MKKFIIAVAAVALMGSVASAQTVRTEHSVTVKKKHFKKHHRMHARDGYYRPGIPTRDPGRYSNLPGKDAANSKAFIQDH